MFKFALGVFFGVQLSDEIIEYVYKPLLKKLRSL
jgi:hypothetical protein